MWRGVYKAVTAKCGSRRADNLTYILKRGSTDISKSDEYRLESIARDLAVAWRNKATM